jgi:hypothetical protein
MKKYCYNFNLYLQKYIIKINFEKIILDCVTIYKYIKIIYFLKINFKIITSK